MSERLPRSVQTYILLVTLSAAGALVAAYRESAPSLQEIRLLPLLAAISLYAGNIKVSLSSEKHGNKAASLSLGFIVTLLALILQGTFIGMLVGLPSVIPLRRENFHRSKTLFNVSGILLTIWVTSHFLKLLSLNDFAIQTAFVGDTRADVIHSLIASALILGMVVFYHLFNATLVILAISLSMGWTRSKALQYFQQNVLWVVPTYLVAGCFILTCVWLAHNLTDNLYRVIPLVTVLLPQPLMYVRNLRLQRERDDERERRFKELESLYSSMVQAMGRAIEAKDRYTQEHIARVVAMSMAIGRELELPEDKLRALEVGAALHDIGKIAIPEAVLNKPGKLTPEEFEIIKEHAALGSEILEPVPFPPEVVEAVRHHHEKWDGTGYPDKLAGMQIPLMARIVAVADVYDALTSDRPYRAAWSHERAMEFMSSQVGTHFNPEIFRAFEAAMAHTPSLCSQATDPEPAPLRKAA